MGRPRGPDLLCEDLLCEDGLHLAQRAGFDGDLRRRVDTEKGESVNKGRLAVSESNLQATGLLFCNSLLSYFIREILHGRHGAELRGLPWGWEGERSGAPPPLLSPPNRR